MFYYVEYGCKEEIHSEILSVKTKASALQYAEDGAIDICCGYVNNTMAKESGFDRIEDYVAEKVYFAVEPFDGENLKHSSLLIEEGWITIK